MAMAGDSEGCFKTTVELIIDNRLTPCFSVEISCVVLLYYCVTSINLVYVSLLFRLRFLLHCRCLVYNQCYVLFYISFHVACAFVILCLLKCFDFYLLTYLLKLSCLQTADEDQFDLTNQ